jgi:hypothetical protein
MPKRSTRYTDALVAQIARQLTDAPYTWREEDGCLIITTRDGHLTVAEESPAPSAAKPPSKPAPPAPAAADLPDDFETLSKTRLLVLAKERDIPATRRWTCPMIRKAILDQMRPADPQ